VTDSAVRIGVVGYGYWGPNLVRNFSDLPGASVAAIADSRRERLEVARRRCPGADLHTDPGALITSRAVDAVVIATPVATHFELAYAALQAGKHVLVEKPLASSSAQARLLIDEAAVRGLVLMVDHTFVYTPAVRRIRELVAAGDLGELYYYDSVRVNLGLFQPDVSVLWDLAVHDLSIMDFVLGRQPTALSAAGIAHVKGKPENIAYLTMFFADRLIGHVHVNWLAPVKIRQTLIGGSRRMIVFDDLETSEKIKVYDKGISIDYDPEKLYEALVGYRTGDMWAPQLPVTEALLTEATQFVDCIRTGRTPDTDGEAGLRVVRLLEAATASMARHGEPVAIEADAPEVSPAEPVGSTAAKPDSGFLRDTIDI
jgi:predicted dehydrogenase